MRAELRRRMNIAERLDTIGRVCGSELDRMSGPLIADRLLDRSRPVRLRRDAGDTDAHAGRRRDDGDAGEREAARLLLGLDVCDGRRCNRQSWRN